MKRWTVHHRLLACCCIWPSKMCVPNENTNSNKNNNNNVKMYWTENQTRSRYSKQSSSYMIPLIVAVICSKASCGKNNEAGVVIFETKKKINWKFSFYFIMKLSFTWFKEMRWIEMKGLTTKKHFHQNTNESSKISVYVVYSTFSWAKKQSKY